MDVIKKEGEPFAYRPWPAWATGPDGEKQIFNSEAEVPAGWTHHGEKKAGKSAPAAPPAPPVAPSAQAPNSAPAAAPDAGPSAPTGDVDAAGVTFDPERHASTKTLTKAGLWRMKVGVARPESESTPKPAKPLDL